METAIKKATNEDLRLLFNIKKNAFKPLYDIYNDYNSPYMHTYEQLLERYHRDYCDYYKIICNNNICGGIAVYKNEIEEYWIAIIYIDVKYQNCKIGQKSIQMLFELYPNAKKWGLDFPIDMPQNKKCYENMGFCDTKKREKINDKLTLAVYEKVL